MSNVPAATNTLRILSHLSRRRGPVSAASIAAALDLPRSSVYHLLSVMEDAGYVVHLEQERLYGLGLAAAELWFAYARHAPTARVAAPLLTALVDRVGENAHLAVLHGRDVVYVIEERATGRPSLVSDVGVRLPAHLTASGRAILASMTTAQVRALYPDAAAFPARGEQRWTPSRLRTVLQQARARGHAVEDGDITPGFASVAVAARDHLGLPAAAVALTFVAEHVPAEVRSELAREITALAERLSARLRVG